MGIVGAVAGGRSLLPPRWAGSGGAPSSWAGSIPWTSPSPASGRRRRPRTRQPAAASGSRTGVRCSSPPPTTSRWQGWSAEQDLDRRTVRHGGTGRSRNGSPAADGRLPRPGWQPRAGGRVTIGERHRRGRAPDADLGTPGRSAPARRLRRRQRASGVGAPAAGRVLLVSGPPRSGRTNVLRVLAASITAEGRGLVVVSRAHLGPVAGHGGRIEVVLPADVEVLVAARRREPSPSWSTTPTCSTRRLSVLR